LIAKTNLENRSGEDFCLEYSIRAIPRVVVIEKRNQYSYQRFKKLPFFGQASYLP
jgi:hypothetical protein